MSQVSFCFSGFIGCIIACFCAHPFFQVSADNTQWNNKLQNNLSICSSSSALHVFRQPDRGEASRGPPGPWCSFPAALCKPVIQSHLLVDEHLYYLCSQTTHRPQGHWQAAHCNASPHQLHETT